jgi:hypothetical protein
MSRDEFLGKVQMNLSDINLDEDMTVPVEGRFIVLLMA